MICVFLLPEIVISVFIKSFEKIKYIHKDKYYYEG